MYEVNGEEQPFQRKEWHGIKIAAYMGKFYFYISFYLLEL